MKRCLVVDDSRVVRVVARRILESLDFEVTEAENGQVALDRCSEEMPDAILLDWHMPIMTGIDFLRELRTREGGTAPAVVFCTTEKKLGHIREALSAGASEYIMKPFDSEIVADKFGQIGLVL